MPDSEKGAEVPLEAGGYTYRIPQGGALHIRDDGPLRQWHSQAAAYASGKALPVGHGGELPPEAVALHSCGWRGRSGAKPEEGVEWFEWFVGTEAELWQYRERRQAGQPGQ